MTGADACTLYLDPVLWNGHGCIERGCGIIVTLRFDKNHVGEREMVSEDLWEAPVHGRIGVLADDGERAQCHLCGDFFGNLGGHVSQVHGVSPEEYKERFELK